jgi:multiple sugar transport system permease protein
MPFDGLPSFAQGVASMTTVESALITPERLRAARGRQISRLLTGLAFASPWITGLAVFFVYPMLASFYYGLTEYSVLEAPRWIGVKNYVSLFTTDKLFLLSASNTAVYAGMLIPIGTVCAIILALLLNMKVKFLAYHRTIFYLPVLVPSVALALVWQWVLNPTYGMLNSLLDMVGIVGPGWYANEYWAKPSYVIMSLWTIGNAVVIYLAGLQDVPVDLYDAAAIDGAGAWQKVRNVTLPMITPVIFFNVVVGLIGAMQTFTEAYIITGGTGNPVNAAMFYVLLLYRNAFVYYKMGLASAQAWLLFLIILAMTLVLVKTSSRWVYYGGDEKK